MSLINICVNLKTCKLTRTNLPLAFREVATAGVFPACGDMFECGVCLMLAGL